MKRQEAKKLYEETHAAIARNTIDTSTLASGIAPKSTGVTSLEQSMAAPMAEVSDNISNISSGQ